MSPTATRRHVRTYTRTVNGRRQVVGSHDRTGPQADRALRNLDRAYRRNRRHERLPAAALATAGVGELTLWTLSSTTTFVVHAVSLVAGAGLAAGVWWWRRCRAGGEA